VPIPANRKKHLQSLGLPNDVDTIRRTRHFVLGAGLTLGEMADLASINPNSLRVYLSGCYDRHQGAESNTLNIRAALKEAMDLHEAKHKGSRSGAHYDTAEYLTVRESIWAAFRKATACLVDGAPGTSKSYTFERVCEEINRSGEGHAVYIYTEKDQSAQSFLMEACANAGIPNRGTISQLMRKLRFFLGDKRSVLVVDEAQHLSAKGLETLRSLLDLEPYFGVVLGGSHEISTMIAAWTMEQWRSRLRRTHELAGLSVAEATLILTSELGPMDPDDIAATIQDARSKAKRWGAEYSYISARNLFFAIQDAVDAVNGSTYAPAAQCSGLQERIAPLTEVVQ